MLLRRFMFVAAVTATVASLSPVADAGDQPFYSETKLVHLCKSEEVTARARCRGYITGAADAMHGGHAVCIPANATSALLMDIVLAHIARSEPTSGRRADLAIHKALTAAFPTPPCY